MLSCRLLVLDHAGTTLAQALAADIPFVLFWNPEVTSFTPEAEQLLEGFRSVGILHDTPEAAAEQVRRVWDTIPEWWATTKDARAAWSEHHALTIEGDVMPLWKKTLAEL